MAKSRTMRITDLNMYVFDREIELGGGIIQNVPSGSIPHLRRILAAGYLEEVPGARQGVWRASPEGIEALLAWRKTALVRHGHPGRAGGTRSSLREFMSQVPSDPHYYLVDGRGWIYCDDGAFHPPSLVGTDGGGSKAKRWKTEKGAEMAAKKLPAAAGIRFTSRSDRYD